MRALSKVEKKLLTIEFDRNLRSGNPYSQIPLTLPPSNRQLPNCLRYWPEFFRIFSSYIHEYNIEKLPKSEGVSWGNLFEFVKLTQNELPAFHFSRINEFFQIFIHSLNRFVLEKKTTQIYSLKEHSWVWNNFWQLKGLYKQWKMLFISPQKLFLFLKIFLSFCLDFLVMYLNDLIKNIRLI